jgi:membrane-bound metal-dependent hydrolase YbcI (DUF457 family)
VRWSTHFIVGATAGLIIAKYTGTDYILMGSAGALFGVLPDADIILDTLGIADHRGAYSHSLGSSIFLGIAASIIAYYMFAFTLKGSIIMGFLAFSSSFLHTLTDTLTYSGTKLLWPFSRKKYRGFVRYNDIGMNALIITLCIATIYLLKLFPYLDYLK